MEKALIKNKRIRNYGDIRIPELFKKKYRF